MTANREQERVYQQVGAFTGSKSGARDLRGNVGDITLDGGDGAQGVRPGSIEALANHFGVACQRDKRHTAPGSKVGKAMRGGQFNRVTIPLQAKRQRQKRLHVAARAVGKDGNVQC